MSKLTLTSLLLALAMLLASCGGAAHGALQPAAEAAPAGLPALQGGGGLPSPAELAKRPRGTSSAGLPIRLGFDHQDSNSNVGNDGSFTYFAPMAASDQLWQQAWALYELDIADVNGSAKLYAKFDTLPAPEQCWIGVANFTKNRWEWDSLGAQGQVTVNLQTGAYSSPAGQLWAVVLMRGPSENYNTLSWIRLGENLAPVAALESQANAEAFNLPTQSTDINGFGSYDPEGSELSFAFDLDDDGVFEVQDAGSETQVQINANSAQKVALRVTDADGSSSTDTLQFTRNWVHTLSGANPGGTSMHAVASDASGNAYFAGSSEGIGAGGTDALIAKYDKAGALVWSRAYGSSKLDRATGIVVDSLSNVYVTGTYYEGSGYGTLFLIKLNEDGVMQWQRVWNQPTSSPALCIDAQDHVYVAAGHEVAPESAFVARVDSAGMQSWAMDYSVPGANADSDAITTDATGNLFVFGSGVDLQAGNGTDYLAFSLKADDGSLRWQNSFGSSDSESAWGLCCSAAQVFAVGELEGNGGTGDGEMLAFDPADGSLNYARRLDLMPAHYEAFRACTPGPDGGCLVSASLYDDGGYFDLGLLSFDAAGQLTSKRHYGINGDNEYGNGLLLDQSGWVYLCGAAEGLDQLQVWSDNPDGTLVDASGTAFVPAGAVSSSAVTPSANMGVLGSASGLSADTGTGGALMMRYYN